MTHGSAFIRRAGTLARECVCMCEVDAYSKNGEMPLDIAIELTSSLQYLINTWLFQVR